MTIIQKTIPILTVASFLISGAHTLAMGQDATRFGDKSNCKSGDLQRRVQVPVRHRVAGRGPVPKAEIFPISVGNPDDQRVDLGNIFAVG